MCESRRDSAIYEVLERGPLFSELIEDALPRDALVSKVGELIAPAKKSRGYSIIIGEHGARKTSLIQLAVCGLKEPGGIVYVKMPDKWIRTEVFINEVRKALGWTPDPVIASQTPDPCNSCLLCLRLLSPL